LSQLAKGGNQLSDKVGAGDGDGGRHGKGVGLVVEVRKDTSYDWLSLRARAFRLLVNEYDQLRRAVTFVRWDHGDANAFAPSLHSGAHKRRSRGAAGSGSGSTGSDPALPGSEEPTLGGGDADVVPPGMPGASPFES
jgi:hypothetical protein